jgi:hypothetical protein
MTTITLDSGDAAELAEALTFVADWLRSDPKRLQVSLSAFVGSDSYSLDGLHNDLARFAFLLGDDGHRAFSGDQP